MTQAIFFDYCNHFVDSLPPDQGKDGLPCILFLDGHASRWNIASIRYLMLNNVYPFYLASHTSIWSQPNDNGTIKCLHSCIEDASVKRRRYDKAIIPYFNGIFVEGWRDFILRLISLLAQTTQPVLGQRQGYTLSIRYLIVGIVPLKHWVLTRLLT